MTGQPRRIDNVFAAAARNAGSRKHLILMTGAQATYGETWERAARLAGAFIAAGVAENDRICALSRNSRELVEFYIACGIAGVIGVAINGMSTAVEVGRIFADCAPAGLFVEDRLRDRVPAGPALEQMRLRLVAHGSAAAPDWTEYEAALAKAAPASPRRSSPFDPAMMIYSSGTTGAPKGILLRHSALVANAEMTSGVLGLRSDDRFMTILPLFSSFGHSFDFMQAGLVGASTVILEQFDEAKAVQAVERFKVSFLAGVPTMFARMFDAANIVGRDLSSLRLLDVGGGPVSPVLKQMLAQKFGIEIVESYGLTEISPVASVQRPGVASALGSCGPPLPGVDVRVIGLDGQPAKPGEAGELHFRSDTLMIGYWNQPDLTAEAIRDGWLRSGDIGKVDENDEIHILDRSKDMIVSNGYNVYPKEVENAIAELAGVQSVAVVGVKHEIAGELIHAFVVVKPGHAVTKEQVLGHCAETLASFKRPKAVHFIDAMPLTGSGKIRRVQLRERLTNESRQRIA